MKLIMLRHGHDLPGNDGRHVLSQQGRAQVAATIDQLPGCGVTAIDLALCADTLRARETLYVARERITITRALGSPSLQPGGPSEDLLALLSRHTIGQPDITLLVVGHEPQLSNTLLQAAGATLPAEEGPRATLGRGDAVLAHPRFVTDHWMIDPDELVFLGQAVPTLFSAAVRLNGACSA